RQGRSRDGLKVIRPDEFDSVIEFHIEGLQLSEKRINKNRKYVPGFCYLQVEQRRDKLQEKYPKLDIVPALRLRVDEHTRYNGNSVNADIHAVCKWKEEDAEKSLVIANQMLVWHINSAGYERYTLDVARTIQKHRYILTAHRILKTYFTKTKAVAKSENRSPPPIATVLKSYHLKQIAFYLILYACHLYPSTRIDGVQRALVLFVNILHTSLEKRHLPHFFYSNSGIRNMFQGYPTQEGALRFDLYRKIPNESLRQAEISYQNHLIKDIGFGMTGGDHDISTLRSKFSNEIEQGVYF
ncbi:uncharacterized protein LOC128556324, partial [Mercenaria mercenaria]|uniref:uncharacterized protein LOC128556324 n=1 Tax=Mercenaria mercenaria TaxID=6596 RepID=UPI00234EBE9A